MKSVLLIFGTRPEAIKMCPLIRALRAHSELKTIVAVTGQHREMLDDVLQYFQITPAFDLNLFRSGASLSELNSRVLMHVGSLLNAVRPDLVLVHGDTATAFASAVAAFFQKIPIGHVEAGLRTYRIDLPFPEEFNRRVISLISAIDFVPTERARKNLLSMGKKRIHLTGNTVIDALKYTIKEEFEHPILTRIDGRKLLFCTVHRRESLGKPMEQIFRAIFQIAEEHSEVYIVCPLHKNPKVREAAQKAMAGRRYPNVELCEPLNVFECHNLLARSRLVLTDSGGLQEEASACGIPVLILREETERVELIEEGGGILCGCSEKEIETWATNLLTDEALYRKYAQKQGLYGNGNVSEKIISGILEFFAEEAGST